MTLSVTLQSLIVAPLLSVRELASAACRRPPRKDLAGLAARGAENGFTRAAAAAHAEAAESRSARAAPCRLCRDRHRRRQPASPTLSSPNSTSVSAVFTTNSALFKRSSLP